MTPSDILDAHHHLWDPGAIDYTLFEAHPRLAPLAIARTADDYDRVAARQGITRALCVEVASAGADGEAETAWLRRQIERSSITRGLIAWAPIEDAEVGTRLDHLLADNPGVIGVRRSLETAPPGFATEAAVVAGIRAVAAHGLPFDLVLFGARLSEVTELVRRVPEATFVLDHLGKPVADRRALATWRRDISRLAGLDNVVAKVSGLFTEAASPASAERYARPLIEHAAEAFGWQRLMFGTDWPVCELVSGGISRWMDCVADVTRGASDVEREAFYRGTAERTYRPSMPSASRANGEDGTIP